MYGQLTGASFSVALKPTTLGGQKKAILSQMYGFTTFSSQTEHLSTQLKLTLSDLLLLQSIFWMHDLYRMNIMIVSRYNNERQRKSKTEVSTKCIL